MENKSAPPRKTTRRSLLRKAALGAGLVVATEVLKPFAALAPVQAAEALAPQVRAEPPEPKDKDLVEGAEREFRIRQLKAFLGEFVTPQALELFGRNGLIPEAHLKVKTRNLPGGGDTTTLEVTGTDGLPYTVGLFVNRPDGLIKEATIFGSREGMTMDQYAVGVKTWLKNKNVEFADMFEEFPEEEGPEYQTMMQRVNRQTLRQAEGEEPDNRILHADVPPPPIVYKHPDLNVYFNISQNTIDLYPDGQVVFHRAASADLRSPENTLI